ncbi:restriction endonuclease subunit S [Vibrio diabolicus]
MSFETATLDSLCELVVDCPHSTPKWTDEGIIVLRNQNIKNGILDLSAPSFTNEEDYLKRIKRAAPKAGDIVFTREAPMGEVCMIPEGLKCCLGQRQVLLRPKSDLNGQYLFWALQSPYVQQQIAWNEGTGSTVSNVRIPVLKALNIPRIGNEDMVAKSLSDIASKMALNTQTNQTLEQMAQAIFKSWFEDFDPVKAKMNGGQPEGMDAATASLFPEKLVESELGLIPEGWEIQNTQDLFEVKDGTHDSPKKAEEGHYLVTSKHITKGKIDTSSAYLISDADFDKVNQRSKVDTFDILLTMIGTVGEVVVVYDNPVEFAIKNVGLFKTSQRPELVWLFYWHLQSFKMKHYLEVRMAGTTQQYLTLKTLRTIPVVLPSNELLAKFNEVMSPLMEKISDNHKQNQTLSNLRDTLLPKLLSGEIELGQAQELAEVE